MTENIARRGQHITCEYSINSFEWLRVSDVMVTQVDTLPADMTVDEADTRRHKSYLVLGEGRQLVGLVARKNILRIRTIVNTSETVRERFIGPPRKATQDA